MRQASATITIRDVELDIDYEYSVYVPARHWLSNGDPGYPEEGGDFDIFSARVNGVEIIELLDERIIREIEEKISEGYD